MYLSNFPDGVTSDDIDGGLSFIECDGEDHIWEDGRCNCGARKCELRHCDSERMESSDYFYCSEHDREAVRRDAAEEAAEDWGRYAITHVRLGHSVAAKAFAVGAASAAFEAYPELRVK